LPVAAFSMIGKTVSHYRIIEKVGQGGMGEVFLANDTLLHRKIALKFLPPEMQCDTVARKRFLREAHSAAALAVFAIMIPCDPRPNIGRPGFSARSPIAPDLLCAGRYSR
jgi:hypothetical protein